MTAAIHACDGCGTRVRRPWKDAYGERRNASILPTRRQVSDAESPTAHVGRRKIPL